MLKDYREAIRFQSRLTNPPDTKTLADIVNAGGEIKPGEAVSVLPAFRSRETELFRRLFPEGLSPDADLMRALIRAIRSGEVDLAPTPESGWYEYEVHALETFLIPGKGPEHEKLSLSKAYKKRMLEAFKALMTKRRETFGPVAAEPDERHIPRGADDQAPPPRRAVPDLLPEDAQLLRLRPEPADGDRRRGGPGVPPRVEGRGPTAVALARRDCAGCRNSSTGSTCSAPRTSAWPPTCIPRNPSNRPACEARAVEWLSTYAKDPDLAADTRVAVPIYFDVQGGRTRLWTTVGVRLARLNAAYLRPPRIKPARQERDWENVPARLLERGEYVIAVDEFAEAELPGLQPLTRAEFRRVCDAHPTKEAIIKALGRGMR